MEVKDVITIIIGLMTGGATVVLAVITWRYVRLTKNYVRLTRDILEENRQMRLNAQKPIIAIYLRSETTDYTSVYFCVENIGVGAAYGVEFTTDLSFTLSGNCSLGGEVRFLETGLHYFPPGKKREFCLGHGSHPGFHELMQSQLEISTAYKDSVNQNYEECFYLDFREH